MRKSFGTWFSNRFGNWSAVLVCVAGLMAALPYARVFAADEPQTTDKGHFVVTGNWSELKRGWNTLVLNLADNTGQPLRGAHVVVNYDMIEMPMQPPEHAVEEKQDGRYEKRVFFGMRGGWLFNIEVVRDRVADTLKREQRILK